jgi:SAM-dependent methyltransferase
LEGIDSDCLWSKPYDLILAMDVIEHLQDPFQLLNRAGSLLRPGGLLFLQTPNAGSLHRWWKKDKWEQYATEEHLILHTRKSLAISLQRSGWQSFSIKSFSGSSTDSELRFWLKWPVSFMLTLLGCGNALRVIARKTEV